MKVADFDIESLDFVGTGSIVHLPRNEHCEVRAVIKCLETQVGRARG